MVVIGLNGSKMTDYNRVWISYHNNMGYSLILEDTKNYVSIQPLFRWSKI